MSKNNKENHVTPKLKVPIFYFFYKFLFQKLYKAKKQYSVVQFLHICFDISAQY